MVSANQHRAWCSWFGVLIAPSSKALVAMKVEKAGKSYVEIVFKSSTGAFSELNQHMYLLNLKPTKTNLSLIECAE